MACYWTTSKEEIDTFEKSIKDQREKYNTIEAACEIEVEIDRKEKTPKDELNNEMSIKTRNLHKTSNAINSGELEREDNVLYAIASNRPPIKCSTTKNASLVATQVGLVSMTKISDDGLRATGNINKSPRMMFYSGILLKGNATKTKCKIRDKAKHVNCSTGFTDSGSGQKYHLPSSWGT